MTEPHPNLAKRWANRRRMAWASLIGALVGYPLIALAQPKLVEMAIPFYLFCTGVVSMYIGGCVVDDNNVESRK